MKVIMMDGVVGMVAGMLWMETWKRIRRVVQWVTVTLLLLGHMARREIRTHAQHVEDICWVHIVLHRICWVVHQRAVVGWDMRLARVWMKQRCIARMR